MKNLPAARGAFGAFLALLAALLFGASTPLVQRVGVGISAWMTAAMLYAGAACAGLLLRSGITKEAALRRRHWPRLLLIALCGAVIGPVALAWGLQLTSGMSASLMLTLEAVFTVLLSCLLYREHIGRRVGLAIALLTLGGGLLVFDRAGNGATQVIGLLAVMGATVSWAVDNTLSRALADLDPGRVVLGKATVGATCSFLIAATTGETALPLPCRSGSFSDWRGRLWPQSTFLFVGTTGTRRCPYGVSIRHGSFYRCGNCIRTRGAGT